MHSPRYTPTTAASYASRATIFVAWAEEQGVTKTSGVSFRLMSKFVSSRTDEGAGAATVNRDLVVIRRMMAFAVREGLAQENPFNRPEFKELKLREPRPKPNAKTLAPGEVDLFLETAEKACHVGYSSLFRVTAGSGIRMDEARHLEASDIDVEKGVLTVTPKKNRTTKGYR